MSIPISPPDISRSLNGDYAAVEVSVKQIIDQVTNSARVHRELLMHRLLRFREMFEIYWSERDIDFPVKTFGVDVINTEPTKIMHAWYLKDSANIRTDVAFYHRAAKKFEAQIGSGNDAMEVWNSSYREWDKLAIRCMKLNLEDYETIHNSVHIFNAYHEDNAPLYNPDYVVPLDTSDIEDDEDEDENYIPRRRIVRLPIAGSASENMPPAA